MKESKLFTLIVDYQTKVRSLLEETLNSSMATEASEARVDEILIMVHYAKSRPDVLSWAIKNPEFILHVISSTPKNASAMEAIAKDEVCFNIAVTTAKLSQDSDTVMDLFKAALEVNPEFVTSNLGQFINKTNALYIFYLLASKNKVSKNHRELFSMLRGRVALPAFLKGVCDLGQSEIVDLYLDLHPTICREDAAYYLTINDVEKSTLEYCYNRYVKPEYSLDKLFKDKPSKFPVGIFAYHLGELLSITDPEHLLFEMED